MTEQEVMQQLEAMGSEQTRKTYLRHGVGASTYGVSYANFYKLKKQIKRDTALARQLWANGHHDARVLATLIADPKHAEESLIDAWAQDLPNYVISDAFSSFVSQTRFVQPKMEAWIGSDNESLGRAGWHLLAHLAKNATDLSDSFFEPYLETIVRDIHTSQNRIKQAMNSVLIAIGMRGGALESKAIAAARQIGVVDVDHGDTSCLTPDAEAYILKGLARKRA